MGMAGTGGRTAIRLLYRVDIAAVEIVQVVVGSGTSRSRRHGGLVEDRVQGAASRARVPPAGPLQLRLGGKWLRRERAVLPAARPSNPIVQFGQNHCPVPLWEREFCSYVGNISWQRFCENKQYAWGYNNIEQWDDSGAFENFQNSKARFWANYHGQPSDIPLPNSDMYIDKVDHRCKVDPELVAELGKVGLPFDSDNNPTLANTGADSKCTQNESGNWDIYIEKPAEVDKWELEANLRPNSAWGAKDESSIKWGNSNSGWSASWSAPLEKPSWRGWSNNRYSSGNRSNNIGNSADNRYPDERPSHTSGRKRNGGGGHFQQRSQDEGLQQRTTEEEIQQGLPKWSGHRRWLLISW
ncbi:hypothetical protein BS78_02G356600 [Paspalum vaginatum]|nr:hypothetical protein BS78_02G356600 [Paspalum vaginatum]